MGLYLEGNAARNHTVSLAAGEISKQGHRRPWEAAKSNEYAGHGGSGFPRIVACAPHPLLQQLQPPGEGEVVLQQLGSLAKNSGKGAQSIGQIPLGSEVRGGVHRLRVSPKARLRISMQVGHNSALLKSILDP